MRFSSLGNVEYQYTSHIASKQKNNKPQAATKVLVPNPFSNKKMRVWFEENVDHIEYIFDALTRKINKHNIVGHHISVDCDGLFNDLVIFLYRTFTP